ncbi:MAG: transcriptional regulator [Neisseria sp.]|nr:transcriptional regulator [Neisseria sp.]
MQQAFQTALRPSRLARGLTILLHLAAAVLCLTAFYGWMRWLGLLWLGISFAYAWRKQSMRETDSVHKIAVNPEGRAALFVGSGETAFAATLKPRCLIIRQALFLQWHVGDKTIRHCVLPDMTDRESYRRLMVWAKWGQPKD